MPTNQENYRRENIESNLSGVAGTSQRLKNQMEEALMSFTRDEEIVVSRLTDGNLTDADYFHSGTRSATIGEVKDALRAVLSYSVHVGELTTSEAETKMGNAGIEENTVLGTDQIASYLSALRV